MPGHVGIIPDGNRRWAENRGFGKQDGYRYGLEPGLKLLELAGGYGVREITYYGFTVDNCKRPREQIESFSKACVNAIDFISKTNASLLVVGNTASPFFPDALLQYTERTDFNGGGIKVNFLVNYGWEWDLSGLELKTGRKAISEALKSSGISRVDLVIRWGGMRRLSGFLPVQSVYADFYVVDSLWPDFEPAHFYEAMDWYNRQDVTLGG